MCRKTLQFVVLALLSLVGLGVAAGCGASKPKAKIGVVIPQTGAAAGYGQVIQKGIELAYELNQADTAYPYTIQLDIRDSASDPQQAKSLADDLYRGSIALIGGVTSDEALARAEAARRADRVLLSPSASSTKLTGIAASVFFRLFPSIDNEASTMATFAKDVLKIEDLILLAEESEFGRDAAGAIKEKWPAVKGEVTFTTATAGNAIARAALAGSKTAYVAAAGPALVAALEGLRQSGFGQPGYRVLTTSALASPDVITAAGQAGCNVYFTQSPFDLNADTEPIKSFRAAYQAKYGSDPDLYAASGYDSFKVLEEAIRKNGIQMGSSVAMGLRALSNYQGVTGTIQFRDTGDVQRFVRIHYVTPECKVVDFDSWYKVRQEEIRKKLDELDKAARQLRQRAE